MNILKNLELINFLFDYLNETKKFYFIKIKLSYLYLFIIFKNV